MQNTKIKDILKIMLAFLLIFTLSFTLVGCGDKMSEEEKAQYVEALGAGADTAQQGAQTNTSLNLMVGAVVQLKPILEKLDYSGTTKIVFETNNTTVNMEYRVRVEKEDDFIICKIVGVMNGEAGAYIQLKINYDFENKIVLGMTLYVMEKNAITGELGAMSAVFINNAWNLITTITEDVKTTLKNAMDSTFEMKVTKTVTISES